MTQSFSVNFEITDRNLAAFCWIIKQINVNIEVFPQFSGGLKAETSCFSGVGSVGMFIFRFLFSFYQEVAVRLTDRDGAKLVVLWTPLHALQGLLFTPLLLFFALLNSRNSSDSFSLLWQFRFPQRKHEDVVLLNNFTMNISAFTCLQTSQLIEDLISSFVNNKMYVKFKMCSSGANLGTLVLLWIRYEKSVIWVTGTFFFSSVSVFLVKLM